MKTIILLISIFHLAFAIDESSQIKSIHPLINSSQSNKLLCEMQSDMKTYIYETPLSTYTFFNEEIHTLHSKPLITWVHGDTRVARLGTSQGPHSHPVLDKEESTHLGDYRYDIFTLLSDLLLQMKDKTEFSGSKEKAILGTLIDGYFDRLKDATMPLPSSEDSTIDLGQNDALLKYTQVSHGRRTFNTKQESLTEISGGKIKEEMNKYLLKFDLLPIKSVAVDEYGNYLLLCEGKGKRLDDDLIFTLCADVLPISYQIDMKMKKDYLSKSLLNKNLMISSFNKNRYTGIITIDEQDYFVNKLTSNLQLKPLSEDTNTYKNYSAALGYILASFHSNPTLETSKSFTDKANRQVKRRLLKTEIISMVYAYNEAVEERWESFTPKKVKCD